jgi:hypothetical protein
MLSELMVILTKKDLRSGAHFQNPNGVSHISPVVATVRLWPVRLGPPKILRSCAHTLMLKNVAWSLNWGHEKLQVFPKGRLPSNNPSDRYNADQIAVILASHFKSFGLPVRLKPTDVLDYTFRTLEVSGLRKPLFISRERWIVLSEKAT